MVDVGGESSRPGAEPVSEAEELRRVVPVVEALAPHVRVSVDTVKPAVAEAAVAAGATLVNDISATLWPVAAGRGGMGGHAHAGDAARPCRHDPRYDDVVAEVRASCGPGAAAPTPAWARCGWTRGSASARPPRTTCRCCASCRIWSPGLPGPRGHEPQELPRAAWRRTADGGPAPVTDRLAASLATATWAMLAGAAMVRVHDVAATVQAATLVGRPRAGTARGRPDDAGQVDSRRGDSDERQMGGGDLARATSPGWSRTSWR